MHETIDMGVNLQVLNEAILYALLVELIVNLGIQYMTQ